MALGSAEKLLQMDVFIELGDILQDVKLVLLYGSETWTASAKRTKRLQTFVNNCLKKIMQNRWPDDIGNEEPTPQ